MQTISTEQLDQFLQSVSQLAYKQRQSLKQYISSQPIQTCLFRQMIIHEGQTQKKGILILEGTCIVVKRVANGRIVFAQLGAGQLANLQLFLFGGRAGYSVVGHSGCVRFLGVAGKMLAMLFQYFRDSIVEREKSRNAIIQQKIAQITKKQEHNHKQSIIDKLSLPSLKLVLHEQTHQSTKSLHPFPLPNTNTMTSLGKQTVYSKAARSISHKKIANIDFKLAQPNRAWRRDSQEKDKERERERQNTLGVGGDSPGGRNQRIFKEHLKYIIKRKLVYEKKHLGVLKAFRNQQYRGAVFEEDHELHPQQNQLDQYFRI